MDKQKAEAVKNSKENDQEVDAANLGTACSEDSNDADYLKRMIDENPKNPLFLKKYAQFLFQVRLFFMLTMFCYLLKLSFHNVLLKESLHCFFSPKTLLGNDLKIEPDLKPVKPQCHGSTALSRPNRMKPLDLKHFLAICFKYSAS